MKFDIGIVLGGLITMYAIAGCRAKVEINQTETIKNESNFTLIETFNIPYNNYSLHVVQYGTNKYLVNTLGGVCPINN